MDSGYRDCLKGIFPFLALLVDLITDSPHLSRHIIMADQEFSSDPDQPQSPPRPKKTSRSKSKTVVPPASREQGIAVSKQGRMDKDALRRHNALEKQCEKAQKTAQLSIAPTSPISEGEEVLPQPDLDQVSSVSELPPQRV